MEKQTKHRILGIFVVIGIVIILLPFFQGGNNFFTETALVKAPPFPDQATQVASAAPVEPHASQDDLSPPIETNVSPPQRDTAINEQPDDTISITHPSVVNAPRPDLVAPNKLEPQPDPVSPLATIDPKTPNAPAASPTQEAEAAPPVAVAPTPAATIEQEIKLAPEKTIKTASKERKKPIVRFASAFKKAEHIAQRQMLSKVQVSSLKSNLTGDNGLFDLKNPVWVIQMGSFKNKTNALKLVNQLRANGYPAFIQKMSATGGDNTRVFVGPSIKRASANALASKLETDMHLRGIVISYKPLTL